MEDGVDLKKSKYLGLEKELCQVHMARCQQGRVHAIHFSAETVGKTIRSAHLNFKKIIGNANLKRCTKEIKLARKKFPSDDAKFLKQIYRKKFPSDDAKFLKQISKAKDNILDCFSGVDYIKNCKKKSSVYSGTSDNKILKSTPFKRPLHLARKDKISLQAVINFRLNAPMAYCRRNLRNTNRVESLHLRTPKFKTYKKIYANRNHSAMHLDSVGAGISILTLLRQIKTAPATTEHFKKIQKKCKYHSLRQKSEVLQRQRKYLSIQKARLQLFVQKVLCSEGSMFKRSYIQKVLCSEGSMFRRFYVQKVLCSEIFVQKVLCLESTCDYLSVPIGHTTLDQRQ